MTIKNARIKDIARLAGVSIGTVDRVLHNRGEVAQKTRQRVQRIVEETKYSPNVIAQVLKSSKRYHLVSLLPEPSENNSFWQKHPVGMIKAVNELNAFPVTLSQVNFDIQSEDDFQKKAADVIRMGANGVILSPIFKTESIAFCSRLSKEKIPFVFIDGFIEETNFLSYNGEDVFKSGCVAGQLTDMITGKNNDILVVNIAKNVQNVHHLNNRTNGFLTYLQKSGSNKGNKITVNIADPSSKAISNEMDKIFKKYSAINSVFISGSKSYLIASYLEEKKINGINLIGYDLLDSNVKYLKSGIIRFLLGQRPEEQTFKAVKKLFEFLSLNKLPDKFEYLPVDIITSENVDYFL